MIELLLKGARIKEKKKNSFNKKRTLLIKKEF